MPVSKLFSRRRTVKEIPQFVEDHSHESRLAEANRVRGQYPDRVPCVVEVSKTSSGDIPAPDKKKYLVPGDIPLGAFIMVLRRRMKLSPTHALFALMEGTMPPTSLSMAELYVRHKRDDNFLYLMLTSENTFGGV
ncbi:Autophagy- protein 8d [Rhizophlyctis rosea]|nr:Autophagy- protein 8d [Rhizophlyctis rosea]